MQPPYQIEVELKNDMADGLRQNLEMMPEFEVVNSRLMRTQVDDMDGVSPNRLSQFRPTSWATTILKG
jgi:hypothetical protein